MRRRFALRPTDCAVEARTVPTCHDYLLVPSARAPRLASSFGSLRLASTRGEPRDGRLVAQRAPFLVPGTTHARRVRSHLASGPPARSRSERRACRRLPPRRVGGGRRDRRGHLLLRVSDRSRRGAELLAPRRGAGDRPRAAGALESAEGRRARRLDPAPPESGGTSRSGFLAAGLLFVAAYGFSRFVTPNGSPRAIWMARLYLQLGDPNALRAHPGRALSPGSSRSRRRRKSYGEGLRRRS